jgi:Tol biopolymer transport system component
VSNRSKLANGPSAAVAVSAGGRYVLFNSTADNLVRGDTNGVEDVFIRDLRRGTTRRVSIATKGHQGNGASAATSMSADGRFVVFSSLASNLVARDHNHRLDVFVRDRLRRRTVRVSVTSGGHELTGTLNGKRHRLASSQGQISSDGRHVLFAAVAPRVQYIVNAYVRDLPSGVAHRVTPKAGFVHPFSISARGRFLLLAVNDSGEPYRGCLEAYIRDRARHRTHPINTNNLLDYCMSAPVMSANGRYVIVSTCADHGPSAFRFSRRTHRFAVVAKRACTVATGVSAGGRYIVYLAGGLNHTGPLSLYWHDMKTKQVREVDLSSAGLAVGVDQKHKAPISPDGHFVAFATRRSAVSRDTNGLRDVYLRGPL